MKQGITTKHGTIWNATRATNKGCVHVVNPPMGKRVHRTATQTNHQRVYTFRALLMGMTIGLYEIKFQ